MKPRAKIKQSECCSIWQSRLMAIPRDGYFQLWLKTPCRWLVWLGSYARFCSPFLLRRKDITIQPARQSGIKKAVCGCVRILRSGSAQTDTVSPWRGAVRQEERCKMCH